MAKPSLVDKLLKFVVRNSVKLGGVVGIVEAVSFPSMLTLPILLWSFAAILF